MAKRARTGMDGDKKQKKQESAAVVVTLHERWDTDMLRSINELVLEPAVESVVIKACREMTCGVAGSDPRTRRSVSYSAREFANGRVYGKGLQGVSGWIRRLCANQYYHDVDIVNCGPVLFSQVILKELGTCPALIQEYVVDRQRAFQRLRDDEPDLRDVPDAVLKKLYLCCFHAGKHTNRFADLGWASTHAPITELEAFERSLNKITKKLMRRPAFKAIADQILADDSKTNKVGTFLSWLWQAVENQVILELESYLRVHEKRTVGVLVFDGLMVERTDSLPFPADVLRRAEQHLFNKLGYQIQLLEKSLTPLAADYEKLWGERALQKIKTDDGRQLYLIAREGQLHKLKRQGEFLMRPHKSIPGVYFQDEESADYINRVLKPYHCFRSTNLKKLCDWFSSTDHPMFELLTAHSIQKNVISFLNGFYNLDTLEFQAWATYTGVIPVTDHFFEVVFVLHDNKPTPLWDNLIETQLGERHGTLAFEMLEIMIGRLFYSVGLYDNWQVAPLLKGDANTGKSTVAELVKEMFPAGQVGAITATQEKTFGLESLYQKRLILIPDLPKKFSLIVAQSDFQSMTSGENVSIARKNKSAVSNVEWKVPLFMAGNYLPDYNDNSGSISRRLVIFPFQTLVTKRNTDLKPTIIRDELVHVMKRCIKAYRDKRTTMGSVDFWSKIVPACLQETQAETKEQTNYLQNFIRNGDNHAQILFVDGANTAFADLETAFKLHMRDNHPGVACHGIGDDRFPLKEAGFVIERSNLCKTCHLESSVRNCNENIRYDQVPHYNTKNRYRKLVVKNMKITTKADPKFQQIPTPPPPTAVPTIPTAVSMMPIIALPSNPPTTTSKPPPLPPRRIQDVMRDGYDY
jgi:hypothetical protein